MLQSSLTRKLCAVLAGIFFILPVFVHAEEFSGFSVRAIMGRDGTVGIEEHFIFDFAPSGSHGVVREIPLFAYGKNGAPLNFHFLSVTDKNGVPYKSEVSSGGNIAVIKIGDKDALVHGSHYYDLRYTLSGIASDHALNWQIFTPVKESIGKLQADIYFPIPVPDIAATATCMFVPNKVNRACVPESLIKEKRLYGYRISAEHISKDGLVLSVNYPRGLIVPPEVDTRDTTYKIPSYVWYLLTALLFFLLLAIILWQYRRQIHSWREERKKPVVFPDTYSYLARALARNGQIAPRDIIATIADLTARGYIVLSPIANPVGEFEFIDYALTIPLAELPHGSEGALLTLIGSGEGVSSLDAWLAQDLSQYSTLIEDAARREVDGIVLLQSDESLPDLPGFKSDRFK